MFSTEKLWFSSLVWLMLMLPTAQADEWKISGTLEQSVEYDDNIGLNEDATPAIGYLLNPVFLAEWNTDNMSVGLTGSGDIRRYNIKIWDCETFSMGFNQQYQQRSHVLSINGGYTQSCSRTDQFSDTGILAADNQSETYNISPAWSWQWSALDQLSLTSSYSKTTYSSTDSNNNIGANVSNFQGNETYRISLSENHLWTRRLSSTLSGFYSYTKFGDSVSSSIQKVFGFQLANHYDITRKWTIDVGGGLNWVDTPSNNSLISNGNDSLLRTESINLALNYSGQLFNYSVNYSRTVNPSASGQVTEFNSANMNFSYKINRKLTFNINGNYSKNQTVGQEDNQTSIDRTFYTSSIRLVWDFAKQWKLSTSYRYRRQKLNNTGFTQVINTQAGVIDSNALIINLNYNWDGLRVFH